MSRALALRFLAPTLAVCLLAFGHALYLRLSTRNPFHVPIFDHLFLVQDLPAAGLWLGILAAAVALAFWPATERIRLFVGWLGRRPWQLAALVAPLLAVASVGVYHDHPLSMDESSARFQAGLFAAGRIWAELDPQLLPWLIPRPFQSFFFTTSQETGWVISAYWPGFALLLAPFVWLGVPWLLNPLLTAASLPLLRHTARGLYGDEEAAGWAMLLALASPQLLVNGISYYSMAAHLLLNLAFAALLLRPTPRRALAAGAVGSLALVLHQPVPHFFFALPWLAWLGLARERRAAFWVLLAGYLPLSLALGVGWAGLRAFIHTPVAEAAGTAAAKGWTIGGIALGGLRLFALPTPSLLYDRLVGTEKLFLWAVPGLPILALLGFLWLRQNTGVRLLAASAVCSFVGYLFVPLDQGHGWGFRYFHQAWAVLPLLAAGALTSRPAWGRLVGILALMSLLLGTALRFHQVDAFITRHLAQRPPLEPGVPQVCFLNTRRGYYAIDLVQNDPLLRQPVLMLDSQGKAADTWLVERLAPNARLVYDNGFDTVWRLDGR